MSESLVRGFWDGWFAWTPGIPLAPVCCIASKHWWMVLCCSSALTVRAWFVAFGCNKCWERCSEVGLDCTFSLVDTAEMFTDLLFGLWQSAIVCVLKLQTRKPFWVSGSYIKEASQVFGRGDTMVMESESPTAWTRLGTSLWLKYEIKRRVVSSWAKTSTTSWRSEENSN